MFIHIGDQMWASHLSVHLYEQNSNCVAHDIISMTDVNPLASSNLFHMIIMKCFLNVYMYLTTVLSVHIYLNMCVYISTYILFSVCLFNLFELVTILFNLLSSFFPFNTILPAFFLL